MTRMDIVSRTLNIPSPRKSCACIPKITLDGRILLFVFYYRPPFLNVHKEQCLLLSILSIFDSIHSKILLLRV